MNRRFVKIIGSVAIVILCVALWVAMWVAMWIITD